MLFQVRKEGYQWDVFLLFWKPDKPEKQIPEGERNEKETAWENRSWNLSSIDVCCYACLDGSPGVEHSTAQ